MIHFVTKAMPINSNDRKKLKSSRTCLIGYSDFISREWLGDIHTQTNTHTNFLDVISRNQACTLVSREEDY